MSTDPSDQINLKIAYLNILQNIIARMSNYVMAIQTASITMMTALLAFSATDKVHLHWFIFFIPWASFWIYHTYFLRLEQIFRNMYNNAANENEIKITDFQIDPNQLKGDPKFFKVLRSKSVLSFHLPLLAIIIIFYFFLGDKACTVDTVSNHFLNLFILG